MADKGKQEKQQNSYSLFIAFWIIFALIILGLLIYYFARPSINARAIYSSSSDNQKKCQQVQVPYEEQEEYLKTEYYTESVPYTDNECENKKLTYKLDQGTCVQMSSGFLGLNPSPSQYSCTITNLDTEPGDFSVTISFNVNGQLLSKVSPLKTIYPQQSIIFRHEEMVEEHGCLCQEAQIPSKQVCHDVTKYREIQRERQVTSYRPITKYRTETKCS